MKTQQIYKITKIGWNIVNMHTDETAKALLWTHNGKQAWEHGNACYNTITSRKANHYFGGVGRGGIKREILQISKY